MIEEVARDDDRLFRLVKLEDGNLLLTVVCGGIGMYETHLVLSSEERLNWDANGVAFLSQLARCMCQSQNMFGNRLLRHLPEDEASAE